MINPSQCRGARALLGITQQQLADLAGISKRTVIEFEGGIRVPLTTTSRSLQWALENAGIEFLRGNGAGSGVRFRNPEVEDSLLPRMVARRSFLDRSGLLKGGNTDARQNWPSNRPTQDGAFQDGAVSARTYEVTELSIRDFERLASSEQRQALDLFRAGLGQVPEDIARRATMTRVDGDRMLMEWQGAGIQLFPRNASLAGMPLSELPDANYGRWAEGRMLRAYQAGEPIFELCHGMVEVDGNRTVWRYYSLRLPRPDGRTLTVTARA
ncbi:helix-turn-helix transcriptional regulator [Thalassobaculum salexigens]|uniref:helix-turn-helix transcriptional regulator n=1 Tax=Thalassobaculum salexigens TaxID=455360 RepID=UPI00041C5EC3|nr:helix-turn-helix domain-containing protein [Thalassobaculum salexigens]